MYFFRRFLVFTIALIALFSTPSPARTSAARAPDPPLRLRVSLFNDAKVDPATLAEAETRASAIFSQSGIEVDWLVCGPADPADFSSEPSACAALAWPAHLSVRIRAQALSISAETFGQAFVDAAGRGIYSNVYFQNFSATTTHPQLTNAEMLGFVLAHELGHLLLGSNSHAPSGLMRARWDASALQSAARSSLLFTPAQSSILRSRFASNAPASNCPSSPAPIPFDHLAP